MAAHKKKPLRCRVCGAKLVPHLVPGAVGGLIDGYDCGDCGVRHSVEVVNAR